MPRLASLFSKICILARHDNLTIYECLAGSKQQSETSRIHKFEISEMPRLASLFSKICILARHDNSHYSMDYPFVKEEKLQTLRVLSCRARARHLIDFE